MKTPVVNRKIMMLTLTMFSVAFLVVPAFATDFEIGTQFGISHLVPDGDGSSITITQLPAGNSSTMTSLYTTWFPGKRFAIGPEFSFERASIFQKYERTSRFSVEEEEGEIALTLLHLGGRAVYFLSSHSVSSPYLLGRFSHTIISGDSSLYGSESSDLTSFGIGLGYQWRIGSAFVLRTEGRYQRLLLSDADNGVNEFSLIIGMGTRFESNQNP